MNTLDPSGRRRDTEYFGNGDRNYFIDVVQTGDSHHLAITRTDRNIDGKSFRRSQIILFEDDLFLFVEALSTVLGRFSLGESFKPVTL